jgi:RHS repeat-associated protein
MFVSVASILPHQFTGKERDTETGLDYFGARYYSGAQGRFIGADPLLSSGRPSNPQTWNRYAYAGNNPLRNIDPTGLYYFVNTCKSKDKACNDAFAQTQGTFRKMYADTETAYDKAVNNGDTKQANALKKTLDGLGAEGKKNARGQTVNVSVDLGLNDPGQTSFAKGSTSIINIMLNPSKTSGVQEGEVNAGHEGVHAGEIMPGIPTHSQVYGTEYDAYLAESYLAQYIGFEDMRAPATAIGPGGVLDFSKVNTLYSSVWKAADIETYRSRGVSSQARSAADERCARGGCK